MKNQINQKSKVSLNLDSIKSKLGTKEVSTTNSNNSIWNIPKHVVNETNWRSAKRKMFLKYANKIVNSGNNKSVNLNLELINFFIDYNAFILVNDFKVETFCKSKSTNLEKRERINALYSKLLVIALEALETSKLTLKEAIK